MTTYIFPADFHFGSATAAAQIEGAAHEDGKSDSIWDVFCREPGTVDDHSNIDVACDHYHRMKQDVALMKELGMTMYRFSISWPRVLPHNRAVNPAGLRFYSELVDELLGAGITPWVTLYHWDLPAELQQAGGWVNRATADAFADYAAVVYQALGDRVTNWTTLNEPWCSSFLSYLGGEHAPGHTDPKEAVAAAHHLLLGHGKAVQRLRSLAAEAGRELTAGITLNFTVAHPANPDDPADVEAARRLDGAQNRFFADPIFRGSYPEDVVADMAEGDLEANLQPGDLEVISTPIDVLGVNFYNGSCVAGVSHPHPPIQTYTSPTGRQLRNPYLGGEHLRMVPRDLPTTDMGWEVLGDDLRILLTRLHRDYTQPAGAHLVVTENGSAWPDVADESEFVDDTDTRLAYLRDHLVAVHDAIEAGADVRGYLTWSLLDNFEWARGYTKRFGIVRVNYETQQRTPKASARWYAQVARDRQFEA